MKLNSSIIATSIRILFFLIQVIALYMFLQHTSFGSIIAGVLTAIGLITLQVTIPEHQITNLISNNPERTLLAGVLMMTATAIVPVFYNLPFFYQGIPHGISLFNLIYQLSIYLAIVGGITCISNTMLKDSQND